MQIIKGSVVTVNGFKALGKARANLGKRDAVKWAGGLQQMLKESQINIRNSGKLPIVIRKLISKIKRI